MQKLNVAVIGGGLVGSLAALNFAQQGHVVHLYEYRKDPRLSTVFQGRSINLALSARGRKALAEVGLESKIMANAIPMCGRMLHDTQGRTTVVIYDPCYNQCLYSVGRKILNDILLDEGAKYANIYCHFEHKLTAVNLKEGSMEFKLLADNLEEGSKISVADLIVGCDGAFSKIRQEMIKTYGFNYSQEYIEHGYLELCIPAKNNQFQMPANYLHIWPRDIFMMIALPNQDKSFTVTLSMPFPIFASLRTRDLLMAFFHKHFQDAIPLIGEEKLVKDFFASKPQSLISVKCNPYHYGSRAVLLGDAAHAMVPYYGQGMNAGMEDCSIFFKILNQTNFSLEEVLEKFTAKRCHDAHTICDLAMYNYIEMRDLTKRFSFKCRKILDMILYNYLKDTWVPLYNSVSFTTLPYSQCKRNRQWQDKVLNRIFYTLIFILITIIWSIYINN